MNSNRQALEETLCLFEYRAGSAVTPRRPAPEYKMGSRPCIVHWSRDEAAAKLGRSGAAQGKQLRLFQRFCVVIAAFVYIFACLFAFLTALHRGPGDERADPAPVFRARPAVPRRVGMQRQVDGRRRLASLVPGTRRCVTN